MEKGFAYVGCFSWECLFISSECWTRSSFSNTACWNQLEEIPFRLISISFFCKFCKISRIISEKCGDSHVHLWTHLKIYIPFTESFWELRFCDLSGRFTLSLQRISERFPCPFLLVSQRFPFPFWEFSFLREFSIFVSCLRGFQQGSLPCLDFHS